MDAISPTKGATASLARWIAEPGDDVPTARAVTAAKHALLDWVGVTLAGAREPLTGHLTKDALDNGESGTCVLVGQRYKVSPAFAALINGAASHALDYDDVNMRMRGHPSVTILPALFAIAQNRVISGARFLDAFIAGTEAACIVGEMMGSEHYERGFHTTATVGTIAAASAVARMLELSESQSANAIGLAATQAAGLQASFGTMAKPLHAGKAAMNGLLAARLAAHGFTGSSTALEGSQGLGVTQSATFAERAIRADTSDPFGIEQNVYKYHAACYYTHSAIECALSLKQQHAFSPDRIKAVTVYLSPNQLKVCDITSPSTGLEVKFSIRHLVAMALLGVETGQPDVYTQELAANAALGHLRGRVTTAPFPFERRTASKVAIELDTGDVLEENRDVGVPMSDLDQQERSLRSKFISLSAPLAGEDATQDLAVAISRLDQRENMQGFFSKLVLLA